MRCWILALTILLFTFATPAHAQQGQPQMMGPGYGYGMMGNGMMGNGGMMMGSRHIEGRLAFLKTELKITKDQEPKWQAYADALRANAAAMQDQMDAMMANGGWGGMMGQGMMSQGMMGQGMMGQGMMGQGMMNSGQFKPLSVPDHFAFAEQHMQARLEMLEKLKGPTMALYDALSAEQKKIADELLSGPMGMM